MSTPDALYEKIGMELGETHDVKLGKMFGKLCMKVNGKAFAAFHEDAMVFKLSGDRHAEAMNLPGSILFDPSGKNKPMKEWVQVSFDHAAQWPDLAEAALQHVMAS